MVYVAFYKRLLLPGLEMLSSQALSGMSTQESILPTSQHIPATFQEAQLRSRATLEKTAMAGGARGHPISITITPYKDTHVWNKMTTVLFKEEMMDLSLDFDFDICLFGDLFFLYDSKGLKLETQRQRVISACIDDFQAEQSKLFAEVQSVSNSSRQYIDLASEISPVSDRHFPQGSTLLARHCCIHNMAGFILDGISKDPDGPGQAEGEQEGQEEEEGQEGEQEEQEEQEEHEDRGGMRRRIYPFTYPSIANLGYSKADYKSLNTIQRTQDSRAAAELADVWSWVWVKHAQAIRQEEESWATFLAEFYRKTELRTSRQRVELILSQPVSANINDLTLPSSAFFVHRTNEFKDFVQGNVHKHLMAMDTIRALYSRQVGTPVATAQLHALLSLAIRHLISHLPPNKAWILNSPLRRPDDRDRKPGFGLQGTMERYGFGFWSPGTIDWVNLKVAQEYSDRLTIPHFHAIRRFRETASFQEVRSFLDQLMEIIHTDSERDVCEFILEKCVHLMLQQYRQTALAKMLGGDKAGQGRVHTPQPSGALFTYERLTLLAHKVGRTVKPCSGNKTALKDGLLFFTWTWEKIDVPLSRKHMEKLPFRTLFHVAANYLNQTGCKHATLARLQGDLVANYFGPFLHLCTGGLGLQGVPWEGYTFESWIDIYLMVPWMFGDATCKDLFNAMATCKHEFRPKIIWQGNLDDPGAAPGKRTQMLIPATVVAMTFGGYCSDDWHRGFQHLFFFLQYYEDSNDILMDKQENIIAINAMAAQKLVLVNAINRSKTMAREWKTSPWDLDRAELRSLKDKVTTQNANKDGSSDDNDDIDLSNDNDDEENDLITQCE
ncbi:hypothetical protein B0T25DRAFT_563736 [Lasiosphaeria hispida]|uniref:Uncharacterized protein n=1 Tax=Lasiosphaeria hispida TaxID=260671 RepID=A0AAJ0HNQ2_9PEZI|nr:hypothetical protein B0T25DRAFT_563736 [Lasiosphaeria hispida]